MKAEMIKRLMDSHAILLDACKQLQTLATIGNIDYDIITHAEQVRDDANECMGS